MQMPMLLTSVMVEIDKVFNVVMRTYVLYVLFETKHKKYKKYKTYNRTNCCPARQLLDTNYRQNKTKTIWSNDLDQKTNYRGKYSEGQTALDR